MIACIDIGGTSIKAGILDENGDIKFKETLEVIDDIDKLINTIVNFVEKSKIDFIIKGLAISSPGAVDTKKGIIYGSSALNCIHGPNFKKILREKLNLNVSIENDANCAALAEIFNGSAKNINNMMFIVCGTGIGGSIVYNGKIIRGKNLHCGEFGFMIMENTDNKIHTFSEVASTISIINRVKRFYSGEWDGEKIFKEANNGNRICIKAIDRFYLNLAKGIYNLQYIYDPELILLGGSISERRDFLDKINEKLDYLLNNLELAKIKPQIKTCTYKKDANLIGALANFKKEYNI